VVRITGLWPQAWRRMGEEAKGKPNGTPWKNMRGIWTWIYQQINWEINNYLTIQFGWVTQCAQTHWFPVLKLDVLVDLRVRGKSRAHFRSKIGGTTPPQFLYVDFVVRGWGDILIPRYSKILQRYEVWIGLNWLVDTSLDISKQFCNARPLSLWGSFDQSPPEDPKPRGKFQLCIVPSFFSSTSYQGGTRIYKAYQTNPQTHSVSRRLNKQCEHPLPQRYSFDTLDHPPQKRDMGQNLDSFGHLEF
jgi:hypothetical protein